jgi:hypothetical protein
VITKKKAIKRQPNNPNRKTVIQNQGAKQMKAEEIEAKSKKESNLTLQSFL